MSKLLNGKVVVVTGASRGIGLEIIKNLKNEGAKVVCLDLNNSDFIKESETLFFKCNVSNFTEVNDIANKIINEFGWVDILINNAGVQGEISELVFSDPVKWKMAVDVNLFGTYNCCRAILPSMIARKKGKIVNFSGGGATAPRKYFSSYAASKIAVVRLTEILALEVQCYGIDVNAIAPGAINTSMLNEVLAVASKIGEDLLNEAINQQEKGGNSVQNTVELVKYLVSEQSNGITGRLISAVHDNWKELSAEKLKGTDWFALRRVDPYLFTLKR